MSKNPLKQLGNIELLESTKLVFDAGGHNYVYPSSLSDYGEGYISAIIADNCDSDDPFFIFYEQDSFQPLLTLVRAQDLESAYEVYVETLTPLSESDLKDYVTGIDENGNPEYDDLTWTDGGFVSTELVSYLDCTLKSVTF